MRHSEKFWWVVIATTCFGMGYGFFYHSKLMNGYCPSEGRYLSEDELIDQSIESLIRSAQAYNERRSTEHFRTFVESYPTAKIYREANPNCCIITPFKNKFARHRDQMFDINHSQLRGVKKYVGTTEFIPGKYAYFGITACGVGTVMWGGDQKPLMRYLQKLYGEK